MKILIGHNHYQQPGGEDVVAQSEVDMLRQHGHDVLFLECDNKDFNDLSVASKMQNFLSWGWSKEAYERILNHCINFKPDVAHFHNTFFMMTPSVYSACKSMGVPVVQTLHNFRLLCANGLFFRQGHVCEECRSHSLRTGIKYGCYRHSRVLTWGVVRMLEEHWQQDTWQHKVDLFIALNDFARGKFIEAGLPAEKICVKPNSLAFDPGPRDNVGDYFVFAGRLTEEKGISVVLEAFKYLPAEKLMVMGDGPLKASSQNYIKKYGLQNIRLLGHLEKAAYYEIFKKAKAVIVPSLWYEQYTLVIIEALACGIPVIASRLGSLQEIVVDNQTGLLFNPGDVQDLIQKINMLTNNSSGIRAWGKAARSVFEGKFSAQMNYEKLMSLYLSVCYHQKT